MPLEQGDPVICQHDVTRPAGFAGSHADRAGTRVEASNLQTDDLAVSIAGQKRALYQPTEVGLARVGEPLRLGMPQVADLRSVRFAEGLDPTPGLV